MEEQWMSLCKEAFSWGDSSAVGVTRRRLGNKSSRWLISCSVAIAPARLDTIYATVVVVGEE
jgi:hypothetical protein